MQSKKMVELEYQEQKVRDRIRSLEFLVNGVLEGEERDKKMAEWHRAQDKLRHISEAKFEERMAHAS